MRYLAVAYNRNDLAALKRHDRARRGTTAVHAANADNLQLVGCTANAARGDYLCRFTHGFPAAMPLPAPGRRISPVAPADRVGWYMTVLNDCS